MSKVKSMAKILGLYHPNQTLLGTVSDQGVEFTKAGEAIKKSLIYGIWVPPNARSDFSNRKVIPFIVEQGTEGSQLFADAFQKIYFPNQLREQGFKLKELSQ